MILIRSISAFAVIGMAFPLSLVAQQRLASEVFKQFAEERQAALSGLESFEMEGEITITVSARYPGAESGPRTLERKFQIAGKGDRIKAVIRRLEDSGVDTYYLNSRHVIEVQTGSGPPFAKRFTLGSAENVGLFNLCPSFFEYAFLHRSISGAGIPALLPSDLSEKKKWNQMIRQVTEVKHEGGGAIRARISGDNGSCVVDLKPFSSSEYQIGSIAFFTTDGSHDRQIEVLRYVEIGHFGKIAAEFRVGIYRPTSTDRPSVTWDYNIERIAVNAASSVTDEELIFDPSSVESIYDGDHGIDVVRPSP